MGVYRSPMIDRNGQKPLPRKEVYTTGEVARLARVATRTAVKWFDSGALKCYRIPGSDDRRVLHRHVVGFFKKHGIPLPFVLRDRVVLLIGAVRSLADALHSAPRKGGWELHEGGLVRAGEIASKEPLLAVVIDTAGLGRRAALDAALELRECVERQQSEPPPIVFVLGEDEAAAHEFDQIGLTFARPFDAQLLIAHISGLTTEQ